METPAPDKDSLAERVAAEIRAEFARRRRSGADYARHIGVTDKTVYARLTGERGYDLDELEAVCAWLGVDPAEIVARAYAAAA